ncbi:hypothetical protein QBC39DRAFT_109107 [Podospora conica]|nr:hypothetical protein QBC39DRAFT_109107 [Schizothecium conicum]
MDEGGYPGGQEGTSLGTFPGAEFISFPEMDEGGYPGGQEGTSLGNFSGAEFISFPEMDEDGYPGGQEGTSLGNFPGAESISFPEIEWASLWAPPLERFSVVIDGSEVVFPQQQAWDSKIMAEPWAHLPLIERTISFFYFVLTSNPSLEDFNLWREILTTERRLVRLLPERFEMPLTFKSDEIAKGRIVEYLFSKNVNQLRCNHCAA